MVYGGDALSGTACTSADGSHVDFNLTEASLAGTGLLTPVFHFVRLGLPGISGLDSLFVADNGYTGTFFAVIIPRTTPIMPIP